METKLSHRLRRRSAGGCSRPTQAPVGPGVTPITGSGQVGPGVSGPGAAVRDNPNNYYYKSISDPVVQHTDKYSYGQMVNDIRALERRYGEHMAVNTIGRSADGRDIYQIIVGSPKASRPPADPVGHPRP